MVGHFVEDIEDSSRNPKPRLVQSLLNDKISQIGMGRYQWSLFFLCGAGWVADNMWLQGVATILPRVQVEFDISDHVSGFVIASALGGMIAGAAIWGPAADMIGRRISFTMTLLIAGVFGTLAAFAPNYPILCILFFLMGSGVGGNLPTDSALFLEFIPQENQGLLTLLSVFWPIGTVISAGLGWLLIPRFSCSNEVTDCAPENNRGWRYVTFALGVITLTMLICRALFFKLLESPKYLMSKGKVEEAMLTLKILASKNQKQVAIDQKEFESLLLNDMSSSSSDSNLELDSRSPLYSRRCPSSTYWSRVRYLFSHPVWITTILIWFIWAFSSFGYNMFNGFLPKFLESQGGEQVSADAVYWRYLVISLFGIPGSLLGWYTVDTSLGRKGTMALATFGTAGALYASTVFTGSEDQLITQSVASFLQNIMWGTLYAYTPEVFPTSVRGTAVGSAAAFSRIFGTLSPIVTGYLLAIDVLLPLYVSAASIGAAGICMVLLPIETRGLAAE